MRRDDQAMCEALRELMKDEIEQEVARGMAQGRAQGRAEGAKDLLFGLVRDGLLSVKDAAARLNLSEAAFVAEMQASIQ
jgi:flagellar biosynthesis/type III secretory pathway protein FliH